jgi:ABC transporter substrate binding protein (PQQ-dependent alcohol dehydrogenase system)
MAVRQWPGWKLACGLVMMGLAVLGHALTPARAEDQVAVPLVWVSLTVKSKVASTVLMPPPIEEGLQGARVALSENATTGKFTGQNWSLEEHAEASNEAVLDALRAALAAGRKLFVVDVPAPLLLQMADLPEAKDALLLDATSSDDSLRGADCRRNTMHLLPSRAMLADTLMQFLTIKGWRNILLVPGPHQEDQLMADAYRRSMKKFRLKIAADKPWTFVAGARRSDTGHYAIDAEVSRFTQGLSYDVLVVADEAGDFADSIPFHTTDPRPVAGSSGLMPQAWSPVFEQWGATQLQLRFKKTTGRIMTSKDFGGWMAVRSFGEAAVRTHSADPATMIAFIHSPQFELGAFRGARLTFRPWDGQLRQPILLADTRQLVSVSPQPGFLHQVSELDTLGVDQPETTCHLN